MHIWRSSVIRVPAAVLGILVGLGVYSFGMFHTFLPTWSNVADVMHCGVPPGAPYQPYDTTLGQSALPLCQVEPGRWTKTPYGDSPLFLGLIIALGTAFIALNRSSFLNWATSSGRGTVALALIFFGLPMMALGLHLNFVEGTLTVDWALHVAAYTLLIGAVGGILTWYVLVRPLRSRRLLKANARGIEPLSSGTLTSPLNEFSDTPALEEAFKYDQTTLRAAADFLFKRNWKARRLATVVGVIAWLVGGALALYAGVPSLLWWIGLIFLVSVALWLYSWWGMRRHMMKMLGKSIQIRMTELDFSISSGEASHTFPWSRFVSTEKDHENSYLFLTRSLAYILPIRQVSEEAREFAMSHIADGSDKP